MQLTLHGTRNGQHVPFDQMVAGDTISYTIDGASQKVQIWIGGILVSSIDNVPAGTYTIKTATLADNGKVFDVRAWISGPDLQIKYTLNLPFVKARLITTTGILLVELEIVQHVQVITYKGKAYIRLAMNEYYEATYLAV